MFNVHVYYTLGLNNKRLLLSSVERPSFFCQELCILGSRSGVFHAFLHLRLIETADVVKLMLPQTGGQNEFFEISHGGEKSVCLQNGTSASADDWAMINERVEVGLPLSRRKENKLQPRKSIGRNTEATFFAQIWVLNYIIFIFSSKYSSLADGIWLVEAMMLEKLLGSILAFILNWLV